MAQGGEISFDMSKAKRLLDFAPRYSLEDSIRSIKAWVDAGGLLEEDAGAEAFGQVRRDLQADLAERARFDDYLSVIVHLESQGDHVVLRLVKDHENADLAKLHLELDPRTLLLRWS